MTDKTKDSLSISFQEFTTGDEPVRVETSLYKMDCTSHGICTWTGECICAPDKGGCGRVWHLGEDSRQPPESYGSACVCGKPLHSNDPKSSAMPICPTCFVSKWHEQQDSSC